MPVVPSELTTSKIIRPPRLRPGATLGVIATSSPIDEAGDALVERGFDRLRDKGFEIVEAPNCRTHRGHAAGTIRERVDALHAFFADPDIDGIVSFWGGMQTHQLLESIDWELIAANPKPLVGYSDLTALTNAVTHKTGLVTFSGPAVITFAKPTLFDYSWRGFERVLMEGEQQLTYEPSAICSDNPWYERDDKKMLERPAPGWRCYQSGKASGPIVGGNLGTLLLLAGTPYWPEMEGRIFFVEEDEDESTATIDRMFTQARQMGVFDKIAGLVVGRFASSVEFSEDDSLEMILDDALRGYDFPVMLDVDFGHTDPLLTFPIGVECRMDAGRQRLELIEPWVV
ncbi:MAG: S66 peptidase family protein [Persicimonas sp.]